MLTLDPLPHSPLPELRTFFPLPNSTGIDKKLRNIVHLLNFQPSVEDHRPRGHHLPLSWPLTAYCLMVKEVVREGRDAGTKPVT
jgi:hypothetical protein